MILMPDRNYSDVIECIRGLEAAFNHHGWKVLSDVSKYIDNHDNVIMFQNAESHANVLFAPLTEYVKVTHLVASVMTRLFPLCFEVSPVTTDELVLLRTLFNQDDAEFIRITDARYNELNLYEAYLKNSIGNFCNTDYEDTIRYPIIGEIGDVWFVWALGHQSAVPKTANVRIETIDMLRGDGFKDELQLPRKRKKRKGNR